MPTRVLSAWGGGRSIPQIVSLEASNVVQLPKWRVAYRRSTFHFISLIAKRLRWTLRISDTRVGRFAFPTRISDAKSIALRSAHPHDLALRPDGGGRPCPRLGALPARGRC